MSATTALLRGRTAAEALMLDTVLVERRTGETTDDDTGVITPTWTEVYAGKGKVQQSAVPLGEPRDLGQASVTVLHLELHLPIAATGVLVDDRVTVTTAGLDPDLAGRVFTVRGTSHKTYLTARRLDIQELDS